MERQGFEIRDQNQNFFQLASIQAASLGIPGIVIGEELAGKYGAGTAICSVCVSNLILWLIGVVVISMVTKSHMNAIENIKGYVGKYGGMIIAWILMFTFLGWYVLQINFSLKILDSLLEIGVKWQKSGLIRLGAALGLLSALVAIGGIRFIKWITVIGLPIIFCCFAYSIVASDRPVKFEGSWGFSFSGIVYAVLIFLPGMINLPTFFRHSRSRADSYLALTLMTCLTTFFQISTLWMKFSVGSQFVLPLAIVVVFILLLLVCNNLLNIYFASACWETIAPRFGGAKGYAIVGLIGTLAYTFVQISPPLLFFEDLANCYISSLGAALLMAFLMRIIVRHRPRTFEKIVTGASWLTGCIVATVYEIQSSQEGINALLVGIGASTLFFLCVIFIEETIWSAKKIRRDRKKPFRKKEELLNN